MTQEDEFEQVSFLEHVTTDTYQDKWIFSVKKDCDWEELTKFLRSKGGQTNEKSTNTTKDIEEAAGETLDLREKPTPKSDR